MLQERWTKQKVDHRIHIFGPSGAGTSTLGRALATALSTQHFDTDDFYWLPTERPYSEKRSIPERHALMQTMFLPRASWILSGAMESWAQDIPDRFTLAIRLTLDPHLRHQRLVYRESRRCGCVKDWGDPICPRCTAFLTWADGYEAGDRPGRSLARHLAWEKTLPCPVLVLDSASPVRELVTTVMETLDQAVALT